MTQDVHREFQALLDAWAEAIVANDPEAIGKFADPDWILIGQGGVFPRDRFLESVGTGRITHDWMELDVLEVRHYGDVVLVVVRGQNSGTFNGEAFKVDEWCTDVFVRRADGWKCSVSQLTPVADRGAVGEADAADREADACPS